MHPHRVNISRTFQSRNYVHFTAYTDTHSVNYGQSQRKPHNDGCMVFAAFKYASLPPAFLISDRQRPFQRLFPTIPLHSPLWKNRMGDQIKDFIVRNVWSRYKSQERGFSTILFLSRPLPSSKTAITTSPPSLYASSSMAPEASFPFVFLSLASSIPWSTAFLIICIKGSDKLSIIFLSTSVCSPLYHQINIFANLSCKVSTTLCILWNMPDTGTILILMTIF